MNKNLALIVGLALVAGLGYFLSSGETESHEGVEASTSQAPAVESVAPGALSPALAAEEQKSEELTELDGQVETTEREEVVAAEVSGPLPKESSLRVQVIDGAGKPQVGVSVELREAYDRWSNSVQSAKTEAPDGVAVLEIEVGTFNPSDESPTWEVALDIMTVKRISHPIDPALLSDELIVLEIPATGTVEVSLLDESWKAFKDHASVELIHVPEGESHELSPFNHGTRRRISRKSEGGKAIFEWVELNLDYVAAANRLGFNVESSTFAEGPRRAGEVVPMEVRFGSKHPVLRVRAIDSNSMPYVTEFLDVEVHSQDQFMSNSDKVRLATDADGFLQVDVGHFVQKSRVTLVVRELDGQGRQNVGSMDLSRKLESGLNELGDLMLTAPAVFVGGLVTSEAGAPIADAELVLRRRAAQGAGFRDERNFDHKTDKDGRFVVTDTIAGEEFQLSAHKDGFSGVWFPFELGDQNLSITLQSEGAIEGKVLLDDHIPADRVHIRLGQLSEAVENLSWADRKRNPEEDGSFRFDKLIPGTRSVTIQIERQNKNLFEVEEVEVQAGEVTRDPRLMAIDLRGKLFTHDIEFLGIDPGASIQGEVRLKGPTEEEFDNRYWLSGNPITVISEWEQVDLEVAVNGHRPEVLTGVGRSAKVKLRKGLKVTLLLTGDVELPSAPVFIKAVLVPADGSSGVTDWGGDAFDEKREITTKVPGSGEMAVEWLVERRSASSSVATSHKFEREQLVQVLDIDEGQRFDVSLTQEEMDQLVSILD